MNKPLPTFAGALAILTCVSGCRLAADAAGKQHATTPLVQVNVLAPTQTTMERTTTQPATVHAYYEARIFAKASGYLTELRVDIGDVVKEGELLAAISIPETDRHREAQLATIRRLEADERRAASQLAVAQANIASFAAKRDKAKAEVSALEAGLAAALVELNRVTDLVNQRAVAERLLDEARKKHDAAAAAKAASDAAVASAEAELNLGKSQSDAAQADLDVAKAMTDVARKELEKLDELIKYARLTAPFDGVVTHRNIDLGDLVRNAQTGAGDSGQALFVISKIDKVRIRVPVPERDAPLATVGDSASISLPALRGEAIPGEIARVAGVLEEGTRTMLIEIDLPNPDGKLLPGMFGQATITLAAPGNTVTLPANAVRFDEHGQGYVYVVDDSDQVAIAEVETGLDSGEHIEITAGLQGDERVVGPHLRRLKAGQTVSVN